MTSQHDPLHAAYDPSYVAVMFVLNVLSTIINNREMEISLRIDMHCIGTKCHRYYLRYHSMKYAMILPGVPGFTGVDVHCIVAGILLD